jgi:hypothetical protein
MPPRKKPVDPEKVVVDPVEPMLLQQFRLHCQKRHPQMRFRTKQEHAADHRLHRDVLNHTHSEAQSKEEEEANAEG